MFVMAYIIEEYNKCGLEKVLEKAYTQYTLNKAIRKFGDKGFQAGFEEFKQLHQRTAFNPINPNNMTQEERKKALESLIFIKEKQDGTLKGHTCANRSKQREWIPKEDATSPIVSLQAVLLTATIEAKEN